MADNNVNMGKLPQYLEDAFVKVSFEEVGKEGGESAHTSYAKWMDNGSAQRVATELWSVDLFKKQHPKHSLLVSEAYNVNLLGYPDLLIQPINPEEVVATTLFLSLPRRSSPVPGVLLQSIQFGAFRVAWGKYDFLVYIARVPIPAQYRVVQYQYILHEGPEDPINELLFSVGLWESQLHDEILVFNQGYWRKDHALWAELQKADWKDVILDEERKLTMHKDIYGFFKSEQVYKDLSIPWKRGIIMHGPPGNGKTISIKAIMKECDGKGFAPLYVKSFQSWMGEEASMQIVFDKAREMSPCVLIFEDLDSLINDQNRSYFLNQLDGFEGNDGILCIGTTNHFDRLDPAISTRPSRFDRKYLFDDPNFDERVLYGQYWQHKLKPNKEISFPDSLVEDVANMTDKFSFAYLKEAFVSTLFLLATSEDASSHDFESVLRKVIKDLRKQLQDKPKDFRPLTASAVVPTALPERQPERPVRGPAVRGAPHGFVSGDVAKPGQPGSRRDIAAMARSAVALGRGFIY